MTHSLSTSRRSWLQAAGCSVGAFALPQVLRAQSATTETVPAAAPARQAIVIMLQGGLSHLDSWDLKPEAPSEYRGEFHTIATNSPGYHICEHIPLFAQRMHQINVLRSVYHGTPSHEAAIHWVLTGYDYPGANVTTKNRNIRPAFGSVVSKLLGGVPGLPPYVCIPDKGQLGDRVRYGGASFLGLAHDPFETGETPANATSPFPLPPNLTLSRDVDLGRADHRRVLLSQLDRLPSQVDGSGVMSGVDTFNRRAWELLAQAKTREAFDLSAETPETRLRYGSSRMGQQALLARRLAQAGVPLTLVNFSTNQTFDTHTDNFRQMKNMLLPQLEQAVTTLIDDLEERGLLDSTLVLMTTEFGRTPKINANAGRDHWSDVFSIMLTGGGLQRGKVLGTSNPRGEIPQDRPIHYNDIVATMYRQLGIPLTAELPDAQGRPIAVLYEGTPIPELLRNA